MLFDQYIGSFLETVILDVALFLCLSVTLVVLLYK